MKTRWGILFWVSAFLIGINGCDDSGAADSPDLCPDDPNKTGPGVCGCSVADDDLNNNTIPDCFDQEMDLCPEDPAKTLPGVCGCGIADEDTDGDTLPDCLAEQFDLCPEDPAKTLPGVCGCGVADEDTDGDTLPDCLGENIDLCPEDPAKTLPGVCGCGVADEDTDGDTLPDCLDTCPEDPNKTSQGFCGCGVVDSAENIVDSDGDGVINCLDYCPNEKTKHEKPAGDVEQAKYCAHPDTDGDGYDDPDDACPTDPKVHEWPKDGSLPKCGNYEEDENIFTISHAKDLAALKDRILNIQEDNACVRESSAPFCIENNVRYCTNANFYRTIPCSTCTSDEEGFVMEAQCEDYSNYIKYDKPFLTVKLAQDINLDDYFTTEITPNGQCKPLEDVSLSTLLNIAWDGQGHTIRYTHHGIRCILPNSLFERIISSSFENTTVDLDVETESSTGILASEIISSVIKNVTISGNLLYKGNAQYAGGLAGVLSTDYPEETAITDVAAKQLSVKTEKITYGVGGLFGYIISRKTPIIIDLSNVEQDVVYVEGNQNVGGLFGLIQGQDDLTISHVRGHANKVKALGRAGGMIGSFNETLVESITWSTDEVNGGGSVGGFAGYSTGQLKDGTVHVNHVITDRNGVAGGLIGHHMGIVNNIDIRAKIVESIDNPPGGSIGGLYGLDQNGTTSNITLAFDQITGDEEIGGAIGASHGSNISNLAVRGNLVQPNHSYAGGVVGFSSDSRWENITSYVNTVPSENVGNGYIGGLAGKSQNSTYKNINCRADMLHGYIGVGGLIGQMYTTHNANTSGPLLSNVAVQSNIVGNNSISNAYSGLIGEIAHPETAQFVNLAISSSILINKTADTPYTKGIIVGRVMDTSIKWDWQNTYYYTSGDSSETVDPGGPRTASPIKFAETAQTNVMSSQEVATALGTAWDVDNFVLNGKSVKVPVYKVADMTLPKPFESEEK